MRKWVIFSFAKIGNYRRAKEIKNFIFLANSKIVQPLSMLCGQTPSRFFAVLLSDYGVGIAVRQSSPYHLYYSGWRRLAALYSAKTPRKNGISIWYLVRRRWGWRGQEV
jgi:hypothetical protein